MKTIDERSYIWSDGRVDFYGTQSEGYTIYNEHGFFTESYQLYYDEGENLHQQEYDCITDVWCWRKKRVAQYRRDDRETTSETRYEWDGKTEHFIQKDGGKGYTIHNDYARAVEWYYEHEYGYQEESYAYDCTENDWCKLLRVDGYGFYDAPAVDGRPSSLSEVRELLIDVFEDTSETTEFTQEYEWSGYRQDWENEYGTGYAIYNEYGYTVERFLSYTSWERKEEFAWNCED